MKEPIVMPDASLLTDTLGDGRLHAGSADRNFAPILRVLRPVVPRSGTALEIASGTGQHIAALSQEFPQVNWQPSDIDAQRIDSIECWRTQAARANFLPPICLNAAESWDAAPKDLSLVYLVNLLHLVSMDDAGRIIHGIAQSLLPGGVAFLYGPFLDGDTYRSGADQRFDTTLRGRDPAIGYKDVAAVWGLLEGAGMTRLNEHQMPANNLALVAQKPAR